MFSELDLLCSDFETDLFESSPINTDDIFSSADFFNNIQTWQIRPMIEWQTDDVNSFINDQLKPGDLGTDLNINNFQSISGYIFQTLSEDDCQALSRNNILGSKIYYAKEKYRQHNDQSMRLHDCNSNLDCEIRSSHQKRKPGRPRKNQFNTGKLVKRSEKLWEFLIHLLADSNTCPQLIKWENYEEGTFKFVQSDKVAQLWGNRKKNGKMNYEKFSRAMRYYYKSQVLLPVRGKRLVYKFGPQAKGWRNITPIF